MGTYRLDESDRTLEKATVIKEDEFEARVSTLVKAQGATPSEQASGQGSGLKGSQRPRPWFLARVTVSHKPLSPSRSRYSKEQTHSSKRRCLQQRQG